MQPLELALFGIVSALALALIGTLVRPYVQRRRQLPVAPAELAALPGRLTPSLPIVARKVCPACHREFGAGEKFCPYDARDLVSSHDSGARFGSVPGVTCSRCGRSYDGSKRFCALDGEELTSFSAGSKLSAPAIVFAVGIGKICPTCSQRYEPDATFCARDGAELVSVN
jgi:predicted amidophosphoribosyltransferase